MTTFVRFLVVGGTLAAIYALLAALATSQLPWPKAVSAGVAWVVCIPLGFWLHRQFSFHGSGQHRFALGLYAGTQLLGIGIGAGTSYLFATGDFWPDLLVHLCASALAAVASFGLNRRFTFPKQ
ncbi:GtrA family protein [Rhodobacter sp. SY28-1]|uniref:GtrA family protein n=1 Tax=Rhodobacter sp. SY28-1 TaxID=2562317 RepID=UPI0010C0B011|nr:GtrA family protein [Rhodobacter sp. SY28-1]